MRSVRFQPNAGYIQRTENIDNFWRLLRVDYFIVLHEECGPHVVGGIHLNTQQKCDTAPSIKIRNLYSPKNLYAKHLDLNFKLVKQATKIYTLTKWIRKYKIYKQRCCGISFAMTYTTDLAFGRQQQRHSNVLER